MSFEEELLKLIQDAEAEDAREDQTLREFDERWSGLLNTWLWSTFSAAEKALSNSQLGGKAGIVDGSIVLEAKWNGQKDDFIHELSFAPQRETQQILCVSTLEGQETYSLETLTPGMVEQKVKQFVHSAIREK